MTEYLEVAIDLYNTALVMMQQASEAAMYEGVAEVSRRYPRGKPVRWQFRDANDGEALHLEYGFCEGYRYVRRSIPAPDAIRQVVKVDAEFGLHLVEATREAWFKGGVRVPKPQ